MGDLEDVLEARRGYGHQCLQAAVKVKLKSSLMIRVLDCLDQTLTGFESPESLIKFKMSPEKHPQRGHICATFLAVTVRFSVVDYVRARADARCLALDDNGHHDHLT